MKVIPNSILIPESNKVSNQSQLNNNSSQVSFKNLLDNKIEEAQSIQFSKHANIRLDSRDIALSPEQIKRVENGITIAKEKGVNDSLVLVDNVALVVNIKNKLVITAMNKDNKNVFTNIDGAVIV